MKDIVFVYKQLGWYHALYYFFYKINFSVKRIAFVDKIRANNKRVIDDIYTSLSFQNLVSETINQVKYYKQPVPYNNAIAYLRPNSSDHKVYEQVIIQQEYKSVVEIYQQFFTNTPKQLIDCGANIGLASLYFAKQYPQISITLIEPFLQNSSVAEINLKNNQIEKFTLLQGGVWNKNIPLYLNRNFRDGKEWSINLSEDKADNNDAIQGYCLATLINSMSTEIDILKIDVEGGEKKLFDNELYVASFLPKVKCMAIEIHDEFDCRNDIYTLLRKNNFFYFNTHELTIAINKNYCI